MAKPPSRGGVDRRRGNPVFSGLLVGLVIGLALAIGVAIWVKGSNPFKSDEASPVSTVEPATVAPAQPETAPDFDFYKVLPGDAQSPAPGTPAATPAHSRYYLQAGAFENAAEADNLKAQLALLGVEAQIQTGNTPENGILHRVRIGPFTAMDAVNNTRSLLMQNNIEADLVKESSLPPGD